MSDRLTNFPALAAELKPQCEAIRLQYEEPRSALLSMMHLFQNREGFVSPEAMRFAATFLDLTPAVVESTVSFYTLFFQRPVGKYVLQVCRGLSCSISGANEIMQQFRERLGIGHLETTEDGLFSYEEVECLAACDRPTSMQVNLEFVYSLTPAMIDEMIAAMRGGSYKTAPMAQTEAPGRSWKTKQDTEVSMGGKSKGATDVSSPNNPSGLGDKTGVTMLDRIAARDETLRGRSLERVVTENPTQISELVSEDVSH